LNPRVSKLAEDILRSPTGIAWQARLTASYFDDDARRAILAESALPWPARRRSSPPPEGTDGVEERIITTYPYPIARPYSSLTEKERAMEAFGCLLDTFESPIHFLRPQRGIGGSHFAYVTIWGVARAPYRTSPRSAEAAPGRYLTEGCSNGVPGSAGRP
jgi:hypothetical protein